MKQKSKKGNKEIHADRLRAARKRVLMQALAEKQEPGSRHAREIFHRPAFEGTELAPHRQQDIKQDN